MYYVQFSVAQFEVNFSDLYIDSLSMSSLIVSLTFRIWYKNRPNQLSVFGIPAILLLFIFRSETKQKNRNKFHLNVRPIFIVFIPFYQFRWFCLHCVYRENIVFTVFVAFKCVFQLKQSHLKNLSLQMLLIASYSIINDRKFCCPLTVSSRQNIYS